MGNSGWLQGLQEEPWSCDSRQEPFDPRDVGSKGRERLERAH